MTTDYLPNIPMTLKDLRAGVKRYDYMLKTDGDELEIYPKGERGAASYFTTDRHDALETAKLTYTFDTAALLQNRADLDLEILDAIRELMADYGNEWKMKLTSFYTHGRRPHSWDTFQVSIMQRFRNSFTSTGENKAFAILDY